MIHAVVCFSRDRFMKYLDEIRAEGFQGVFKGPGNRYKNSLGIEWVPVMSMRDARGLRPAYVTYFQDYYKIPDIHDIIPYFGDTEMLEKYGHK